MQRLGIVDLGSNTARLAVFSYREGKWFRLADQIRQPVRLGEGLGDKGRLTRQAQQRAQAALQLFSDYAESTGLPTLEILGTSALRDATNQDEFLDRVAHMGLEISILSGSQEAALGVLAVANGFSFHDAWVVDLGGGSAQISQMRGRCFVEGRALPLGAVRLTERFLRSDPPRPKEIRRLEQALTEHLVPLIDRMQEAPAPLVAMGGTIRNLARAVQKELDYPLGDRLHGYFLERSALEALVDRLLSCSLKKRGAIPGIKMDRADVIVAGSLVYRWLLRQIEAQGIWISGIGLREGALMKHLMPPPHRIENLRSFSVQNLLQHYAQSKEHVELTRSLSERLFVGLRPIHGYGERESVLLDAGAVLQDIGLAVNYYRHDRHGAYLVSSAPLMGFTHREQALLALLVRYHLRGRPRLGDFKSVCEPGDKRLLRTLVACLRLADHLDRPRAQRVRDVEVEVKNAKVVVRPVAEADLSVELWQIDQHTDLFEAAFDRRLVVEPIFRSGDRSDPPAGEKTVTPL
jgi:exopolyphosphatase/guanosine-5'-triphosphate,3'-diphosphate pyrophosphatase